MRRYGMLLLVLVLATASLLAAAAYNTATVTNAASLTIVSTDEALLALIPNDGPGNKDKAASIKNGQLVFKFGGIQPNSVYEWNELFKVENNTTENLDVTVEVCDELEDYVEIKPATFKLNNTQQYKHVSVKIVVDDDDDLGKIEGTITVSATAE